MKRVALALVIAFLVAGCLHASPPGSDEETLAAHQLEGVFPTLEQLKVAGFRNQDWCQFIDYPRGSFTNILDPDSTCNLFDGRPQSFDGTASADFQHVKEALDNSGVGLFMVWNIEYDTNGQITTAEFEVTAGDFDRFSYLYDRDNTISKEPNPDTIVTDRINDDWWFMSTDWN
ncbi:MAG TPA: hypothetical protein VKR24_01065 [Candidatus Limnocylindrales bacterium]|nr:hypothetical protein [Candidatus Limnocylindrales bacterium]